MNQTQRGFGAILRTMVMGISLTTIGSIVLAVVFAVSIDGCSRVAARIKPEAFFGAAVERR
jgi:hypothetical protein